MKILNVNVGCLEAHPVRISLYAYKYILLGDFERDSLRLLESQGPAIVHAASLGHLNAAGEKRSIE